MLVSIKVQRVPVPEKVVVKYFLFWEVFSVAARLYLACLPMARQTKYPSHREVLCHTIRMPPVLLAFAASRSGLDKDGLEDAVSMLSGDEVAADGSVGVFSGGEVGAGDGMSVLAGKVAVGGGIYDFLAGEGDFTGAQL